MQLVCMRFVLPLLDWVNAVTQLLCTFKGSSDARQHILSRSGSRTCFTFMYTTLQSHCSLAARCDTAAVLLRKLTVPDKQSWQAHKVERLWLRIRLPQRCSVLAVLPAAGSPLPVEQARMTLTPSTLMLLRLTTT